VAEDAAGTMSEPTHAENEARLITRRVSEECDQPHIVPDDVGCDNGSCQCWCHE
jgi:hypothetical protein